LPAGLSLSSDGSVSGTPTTAGTFSITVHAVDASDPTNSASASLALVIAAPQFTITAPSSVAGQVGVPLQFQVVVAGNVGTVSWTLTGLPAGITMDSNGLVSGLPASYGTFRATFQALDSYDASRVASAATTLSVAPPAFSIATTTLADGQVDQVYTATLATAGGTGSSTWTVSAGALPPGLSLGSTGALAGTPAAAGTFTFTVSASDAGWPAYVASQSMTINVAASSVTAEQVLLDDAFAALDRAKWPGGSITGGTDTTVPVGVTGGVFVVGPLKASTTGTHYNGISTAAYDLTAAGGASVQLVQAAAGDSYTMFAAAFDSNNFYRWYVSAGQIAAERKVAGTKTALMTAVYNASAQQFLRIRNDIHAGLSDVVFETASSASGPFTVFYREGWNAQIVAGALKFELKAGTSTSIASPGSAKFDNFHLSVPAAAPALSIATITLSDGEVRQAYQSTLSATGGSGTAAWSVSSGALPSGMTLSVNGVLGGTPTVVGASSFTVTATDSGASASKTLTLTIDEQTLLADTFDMLDRTRWPAGLFTSAGDATMTVAATGGTLQIALLASAIGTHYNGISSPAYDLTGGGAASVQLTQPGNGAAYAMFAAGSDSSNYYRWYVSAGQLVAERRIAGTKKTLLAGTYDAVAHQFFRIRSDFNAGTGTRDAVFETAPNAGGAPGTFTEFYREPWDARVVIGAVKFELKAGTSDAIASPGAVRFDNFKACRR
jgi:large repetitive protein